MKMYASYGVLAHEKQPVYTLEAPVTEFYDEYDLILPEGWSFAESKLGGTLVVSPEGTTYFPSDILRNWGDAPALVWYDGEKDRRIMLTDYAVKIN